MWYRSDTDSENDYVDDEPSPGFARQLALLESAVKAARLARSSVPLSVPEFQLVPVEDSCVSAPTGLFVEDNSVKASHLYDDFCAESVTSSDTESESSGSSGDDGMDSVSELDLASLSIVGEQVELLNVIIPPPLQFMSSDVSECDGVSLIDDVDFERGFAEELELLRAFALQERLRRQDCAVRFIQCRFRAKLRMRICRIEFLALRSAAITIQRQYRGLILMRADRTGYTLLQKSVLIIQHYYRNYLVSRTVRIEFLKKREATVLIQSFYRGIVQHRQFLKINSIARSGRICCSVIPGSVSSSRSSSSSLLPLGSNLASSCMSFPSISNSYSQKSSLYENIDSGVDPGIVIDGSRTNGTRSVGTSYSFASVSSSSLSNLLPAFFIPRLFSIPGQYVLCTIVHDRIICLFFMVRSGHVWYLVSSQVWKARRKWD